MKKLYLLVLSIFTITAVAQNYNYKLYTPANSGIASSNIYDIKIDGGGTLWLATYGALTSFNGTTFTNYTTANSQIQATDLRKVAIDNLNRKWIATGEHGVIVYNGTTFTNYTTSNSAIAANTVSGIAVDASNNVYVATSLGFSKFNGTTWTTYTAANSNLISNYVTSVAVDSANNVYLTAEGLLLKFNGTGFTNVGDQAREIRRVINTDVYVDKYSGGYLKYTNGVVTAGYDYDGSCMLDCQMGGLDVDQNNKVWIGNSRECRDGGLQNFTDCTSYFPAVAGVNFEYITCLEVVTSNTIWVGSVEAGLVKMSLPGGTCAAPTNFTVTNVTPTTATLNWTAASPAPNGYTVMYGNSNIQGGASVYTTGTSVTIEGLNPNSDNYWWIASDCGASQSPWSLGGFFATAVAPPCFQKVSTGDNHTIAIKGDGSLWGWGLNNYYQLGLGVTGNKTVPTRIGSATNWRTVVSSGFHNLAIKTDGSLWAWGMNSSGQLGDNTVVDKTTPIRIGTATNWSKVEVSGSTSMAIKTDGTLWVWGANGAGVLGLGDNVDRHVPTQMGTALWKDVAHGIHTLAIKTDGTLWAWGWNTNGELGDNTTTFRTLPVQIGTATNWQSVEAEQANSYAIKSDGTLWGWGSGTQGNIGDGFYVDRKVPTQIGTATNWSKVKTGYGQTFGVKTDGSLYSWGFNTQGELGIGSTTFRSTPVRVGFSYEWAEAAGGDRCSVARKTDGSIYSMGWSPQGQMGTGQTFSSATPYEITCPTTVLAAVDFGTAGQMKVYPNPVKGLLNIAFDQEITSVSVYNILGQEVMAKVLHANTGQMDVSGLRSGTYIVKVAVGNDIKTLKVIKE